MGEGGRPDITTYGYDAAGMRALKKGRYGTVQYVSDNYTVRNKDLISKHVFAGNTRLVSKTVMQEEKSGKMTATEQGAYYYHPDHLGSSNVVTDKDGRFYEQIEYMPYGETWINNKATSEQQSTPYKFTAKEYDPETGWYYYGHRYLDPRLSRWITADPAMVSGEYMPDKFQEKQDNEDFEPQIDLPGMGGVYNTVNLNLYHYSGNNPVKYIDPDGKATILGRKVRYTGIKGLLSNDIPLISPGHSVIAYKVNGKIQIAQYGKYGIKRTEGSLGPYTIKSVGMDDALIAKAVENVDKTEKFTSDTYNVVLNNCNDFAEAVFTEYKNLFIEKQMGKDKGIVSRIKAEFAWYKHKLYINSNNGETIAKYKDYTKFERSENKKQK